MSKTRADLNAEIQDIIKSYPLLATDTSKLQGARHRTLLLDVLDYVDAQLAAAQATAAGDFLFDWTQPSNAFSNYANSETTFARGMWKFLHRDVGPSAGLQAQDPIRQKGGSTSVMLNYAAQKGTADLKTIIVNNQAEPLSPPSGSVQATTAANADAHFAMSVTDVAGYTTPAGCDVVYRQKLFVTSKHEDLMTWSDADLSTFFQAVDGELVSQRQYTKTLAPADEYIYIAYQTALGTNPKVIINSLEDNSFTSKTFMYTNSDGFPEQYLLLKGSNLLSSAYKVEIQ